MITVNLLLDDEMVKLVEYIPEELLPDILNSMLKEAMTASIGFTKVHDEDVRQSSSNEIKELIETVKQALSSGSINKTTESKPENTTSIPKIAAKVISADFGVAELDDLDDFADLFK